MQFDLLVANLATGLPPRIVLQHASQMAAWFALEIIQDPLFAVIPELELETHEPLAPENRSPLARRQ